MNVSALRSCHRGDGGAECTMIFRGSDPSDPESFNIFVGECLDVDTGAGTTVTVFACCFSEDASDLFPLLWDGRTFVMAGKPCEIELGRL